MKIGSKLALVGGLVALGLYDQVGASIFVNQLDDQKVSDMLEAFANQEVNPAQMVAAVTNPAESLFRPHVLDAVSPYLEQNLEGEILIRGLDVQELDSKQIQQLEQRIQLIIRKLKQQNV